MSETNKNPENNNSSKTTPRTPPADAASPFHSFAALWRGEMQRAIDETSTAMERGFTEWERAVSESSRMGAAQARAMHDASRAFLTGAKVMLG